MRVLLDECLPRKLKAELKEHEVRTVPEMGWASIKNGALLKKAVGKFDVLLTVDQNILFQQNLNDIDIAIIALVASSNRLADLMPLMPLVRIQLSKIRPGMVIRVGAQP